MRLDETFRMSPLVERLVAYSCLAISLGLSAGCNPGSTPTTAPDPLLEDGIDVTGVFGANWHGRHFIFQTLEAEMPDAQVNYFLQVEGDGMKLSFHSSSPPFVPVVQGTTVSFGGHSFEVTSTPNQFIVDGQQQNLPPNSLYVFSNGQYEGTYLPQ